MIDLNLEQAISLYLFQQFKPPGRRDEIALNAAWRIIARHGQLATDYYHAPSPPEPVEDKR